MKRVFLAALVPFSSIDPEFPLHNCTASAPLGRGACFDCYEGIGFQRPDFFEH